ncbi:MAG TPA: hypothetical protein VNO70_07970 [Blastocatellia bacterium]|nr:hypothetical protein [Blastocatellia bacterium]
MEFKNEAHKRAFEKTRDYLRHIFGEVNVRVLDGIFMMQEGTTFVYVRAFPISEKNAGVEVFSYVVVDVDVTADLMRFLLTYNLKLVLGAFGLTVGENGKGSVLLTHTLLGDHMQPEELYATVSAIARVADDLDTQIVAAFGGKTALGKLSGNLTPAVHWE